LLIIAWSGRGHSAPPDGGQDLTPTARELSDQALRQYQAGDYDAAIESFTAAFALSNNPGLLFNVAQAYRLKGDCEHARDYYLRYLNTVPDTPFKPSLERRMAEMEACVKDRGRAATPRTVAVTPVASPAPPPAAVASLKPTPSPSTPGIVWMLRGSAAALLASSAVFGALAWDAFRDYDTASSQRAAWDANDRYETDTTLAWTFLASGLACAVFSYLVGRPR
jgi:tetratricopeptide (TPR) repeat protein